MDDTTISSAQYNTVMAALVARLPPEDPQSDLLQWVQWPQILSLHVLQLSPSLTLRAYAAFADVSAPFAHKILSTAFRSVYIHSAPESRESLCSLLLYALKPAAPKRQKHLFLDVLDEVSSRITYSLWPRPIFCFDKQLERLHLSLPLNYGLLSKVCYELGAYGRALRYQEFEVSCRPSVKALLPLMNLQRSNDGVL